MDSKTRRLQKISEKHQVYLSNYEGLTEDERKALKAHRVDDAKTLPEWQKYLETYAALGESQPTSVILNKDSSLPVGCVVLIFMMIMFFIFGITLSMIGPLKNNGALLGQLIVGGVVVSVIPFVLSNYFKKYVRNKKLYKTLAQQKQAASRITKIPTPDFTDFILPLLQYFSEEIPKDTLVELQIDFRDKKSPEFAYTPEKPTADWKYYQVPWLVFKSRLVDHTLMQLKVSYLVRYRRYSKRGRSGKWKTKTKIKVRIVYELTMQFSKKRYHLAKKSDVAGVKIKENEKKVVVKGKTFTKTSSLPKSPETTQVLGLAKSMYDQIEPLKK